MPPLERRGDQSQPIVDKESLLAPGGVENLVHSGRIPGFVSASSGGKPFTVGIIPPVGTKPGDIVEYIPSFGGYEFKSPQGKTRGLTTVIELTLAQAADLNLRIDQALAAPQLPSDPGSF